MIFILQYGQTEDLCPLCQVGSYQHGDYCQAKIMRDLQKAAHPSALKNETGNESS